MHSTLGLEMLAMVGKSARWRGTRRLRALRGFKGRTATSRRRSEQGECSCPISDSSSCSFLFPARKKKIQPHFLCLFNSDMSVALRRYVVPACPRCGGILKPDVTFFGDNVPRWRVDAANDLVASSDGVLVVGSSLMTFSAFRLAKLAEKEGKKIAVLNMGHTRIDGMASVVVKCEAPIGQAMSQIIKCGNF